MWMASKCPVTYVTGQWNVFSVPVAGAKFLIYFAFSANLTSPQTIFAFCLYLSPSSAPSSLPYLLCPPTIIRLNPLSHSSYSQITIVHSFPKSQAHWHGIHLLHWLQLLVAKCILVNLAILWWRDILQKIKSCLMTFMGLPSCRCPYYHWRCRFVFGATAQQEQVTPVHTLASHSSLPAGNPSLSVYHTPAQPSKTTWLLSV